MKKQKHRKHYIAIFMTLCLLLSIIFSGCNSKHPNSQSGTTTEQLTTQAASTELQTEDYSTKKAVSGPYFAERAAVNGFGVENEDTNNGEYKSHYFINFGANDNCEFIEAKTNNAAAEMFQNTYDTLKVNENNSNVVSITNIDKGNYKKYIQQQTNVYIAIICLDNTFVLITSNVEQQSRYEVFLKDINY